MQIQKTGNWVGRDFVKGFAAFGPCETPSRDRSDISDERDVLTPFVSSVDKAGITDGTL